MNLFFNKKFKPHKLVDLWGFGLYNDYQTKLFFFVFSVDKIDISDIFMMSFFALLKAKMTKQDIYLVTLDLVK